MPSLGVLVRALLDATHLRRPLLRVCSSNSEKEILGMAPNTYLFDRGWYGSRDSKESIDANHEPIPWMTYPFIDFVTPRLSASMRLFEYGSGNSTAFFARHVRQVVAVEHDRQWFERVNKVAPDNARVFYRSLDEPKEYAGSCVAAGTKFEIIVIDGRRRVDCVKQSWRGLTSDGVVVLDDCERIEYRPAYNFLERHGFRHIEFWGMSPIVSYASCTTIFYRDGNCLRI